MIEKSAPSPWAGFVSGLLDLNHTRIVDFASVLQIAKFVASSGGRGANFAIRTLGRRSNEVSMSAMRAAVFVSSLAFAAAALAQDRPQDRPVQQAPASAWVELHAGRVRLVSSPAKDARGGHHLAGVEIALAEGWKTYWRTPGDAGVPPVFDWAGSSNVGSIKVLYPAPKRMAEAGGEVIAYKQAVLFPIEVKPQDPAKPVTLKLALEFGICREICIPATASFDLVLGPGRAGAPAPEIAAALEQVPRPQAGRRTGDPEIKRVAVDREGSVPRLIIEAAFGGGGKGADVFVEAPEGLYVPLPKKSGTASGGIVRFETELAGGLDKDLKGKTLTLTLIGEAGASEAEWRVP
jgi:DsbC/DsbD-like thiol-disulfide interchange protein